MVLAVDTETTGADFLHGCKPFFVATCDEEGVQTYWEAEVDPETRIPKWSSKSRQEIKAHLRNKKLVFHNAKFDIHALKSIGINVWNLASRIDDTLIASHLLNSYESHALKDLALKYLDISTSDEKELQEIVNQSRRIGRLLSWRVAKKGDPHFPALKISPKQGWWQLDMWLPAAVYRYFQEKKSTEKNLEDIYSEEKFSFVLQKYCLQDVVRTLLLWRIFKEEIISRELKKQYEVRRRLLRTTYRMESVGITLRPEILASEIDRYSLLVEYHVSSAELLAERIGVSLTNINSPILLRKILFEKYKLPVLKRTPSGLESTDLATLEKLLSMIDKSVPGEKEKYTFVKKLVLYRRANKSLDYLQSYLLFQKDWKIHSSINITGTKLLRQSTSSPNFQNVGTGKKNLEGVVDYNLRTVFGPDFEKIWYAFDWSNAELRVFAYASGDKSLISAFESGVSVHLIIARELWGEHITESSPEYKKTKNGNFAIIYGASETKADHTYGAIGAYQKIKKKFPLIDKLAKEKQEEISKEGFVLSLGGYPLVVREPHKALNAFIQGSVGWFMAETMLACDNFLLKNQRHGGHIIMQVHDELVFEFERDVPPDTVIELKNIMERIPEKYGIPIPVGADRIEKDWSIGTPIFRRKKLIGGEKHGGRT